MLSNSILSSFSSMYFSEFIKKNIMILKKGEDLNNVIKENKLLIVDYFAKWCKACKKVSPKLEEIANSKEILKLIKVDVDIHKKLIQEQKLTVLPTISLYHEGDKKLEILGSDLSELENYLNKI